MRMDERVLLIREKYPKRHFKMTKQILNKCKTGAMILSCNKKALKYVYMKKVKKSTRRCVADHF